MMNEEFDTAAAGKQEAREAFADPEAARLEGLPIDEVNTELERLGYNLEKIKDWSDSIKRAIRGGANIPRPKSLRRPEQS